MRRALDALLLQQPSQQKYLAIRFQPTNLLWIDVLMGEQQGQQPRQAPGPD